MEIDFGKRMTAALRAFCETNGITVEQYVVDVITERLSIDMYGDMNEMRKEPEKPKKRATRKKAEPKPEEEKKVEAKKEDPPVIEAVQPVVEEKPKKKRSLKVK